MESMSELKPHIFQDVAGLSEQESFVVYVAHQLIGLAENRERFLACKLGVLLSSLRSHEVADHHHLREFIVERQKGAVG